MTKQELQKNIGNNLMRQRIALNLTREQLSEKVGISTTFYANLECGNKMMSLQTLQKLADALCVSTDVLLRGSDTGSRILNIEKLLQDQPEAYVAYIENMIRLSLKAIPQLFADSQKIVDEGVQVTDECTTAP